MFFELLRDLPGAAVGLLLMDDPGQGVHLFAVEQYVQLDEFGGTVAEDLIVQGGIASGAGLQRVEEVVDDLVERQLVVDVHTVFGKVLHVLEHTAALLTQVHDGADIVGRREDVGVGDGLLAEVDVCGVRVVAGVVDAEDFPVCHVDLIDDAGDRGNEVQVVFPFQPLLDDLQVQKAQEAAAEAEAESSGGLRFKGQRRVVELQFFQRFLQVFIVGSVGGIDAAEHHGVDLAVTGQGFFCRAVGQGDRIAHTGLGDGLDGGRDIADFPGAQAPGGFEGTGPHVAGLHDGELGPGGHHAHGVSRFDGALHEADIDDDAPVAVVDRVEDEGLQRCLGVSLRGRDIADNVLEDGFDVLAGLGGNARRLFTGQSDDVFHFCADPVGVGGGQVDFIDDRADLEVVVQGKICVAEGLGLYALGGVHDEDRTLAGRQGPGDFVVEVHVARRVDEVQVVDLSVIGFICELDGPGFDGDAALPLNVHVVEELLLHLPFGDGLCELQHAVGQGGLPVVDMGNDGEVADLVSVV